MQCHTESQRAIMMLRGDAALYALHQSTFFENRIGVYIMRVVTRNDLDAVTRLFAERHIPAEHIGTSTGGNELIWEMPNEHEPAIQELFEAEQPGVLWYNTDHDKEWTQLDTQVLDAINAFVKACDKIEAATPANDISDLGEYFADCELPPRCMGQLLMQNLSHVIDGRAMNHQQKVYWLTVADQMGPDWVEQFNRVGIFMQQVDKI